MRKLLVAAALAPAFLLVAAAPGDDILDQIATKVTDFYASKGLSPTGWVNNGALGSGEEKRVSVTLKGGEVFSVAGFCDKQCADMNLHVTSSDGTNVAEDVKDDDLPIVVVEQPGTYTLTVTMVSCKTSKCNYRLLAFAK